VAGGGAAGVWAAAGGGEGATDGLATGAGEVPGAGVADAAGEGVAVGAGEAETAGAGAAEGLTDGEAEGAGDCASAAPPSAIASIGTSATTAERKRLIRFILGILHPSEAVAGCPGSRPPRRRHP
jgi:hypothetical protein